MAGRPVCELVGVLASLLDGLPAGWQVRLLAIFLSSLGGLGRFFVVFLAGVGCFWLVLAGFVVFWIGS